MLTEPPPGPLPHGTVLTAAEIAPPLGEDGPILKPKLQMTSSAWSAAQVSRPARDKLTGTFTPLNSNRDGAANTQTAQTTVKPTATSGTMIASPAGIRAR